MSCVSKLIKDLQSNEYELIQTSQNVTDIFKHCGITNEVIRNNSPISDISHIDHLLVKMGEGEIEEVWVISGIPDLNKSAYLVWRNGQIEDLNLEVKNVEECEIINWYDLTEAEQTEHKDDYDSVQESSFFRYRNNLYDMSNFIRFDYGKTTKENPFKVGHQFHSWQASHADTYFSGIVIRVNNSGDGVTAGMYVS